MQKEGIIKYKCEQIYSDVVEHKQIVDINLIRTFLFDLQLIGVDYTENTEGIGFGNISKKLTDSKFIISGSGTGINRILSAKDYSIVEECDINENFVRCSGIVAASSESLSHFAIYQQLKNVNYVIHIHSLEIWNNYLNKLPTTDKKAEYGTPDMAWSIQKCILRNLNKNIENSNKNIENSLKNIIIMTGHLAGMLFYGDNLNEIYKSIIELMKNSC
jgi:ribulose-5-phosphate 4-epimerase/fuculose-1-phosphate aldolase